MIYKLPVYRVELVRERSLNAPSRTLRSPIDAVRIFRELHGKTDRECLVAIMLDTKNNVRGVNTVSVGDLSSTHAHPREIFKPAILTNAASIVVLHVHPSGDPTPSPEDILVGKRLESAGEILGIGLLDNIVASDSGFVSLTERGFY